MSLKYRLEKSVARARKSRECALWKWDDAKCDTDRAEDIELIYLEDGNLGFLYFCSAHRGRALSMAGEIECSPVKRLMAFGKHFEDDPRDTPGMMEEWEANKPNYDCSCRGFGCVYCNNPIEDIFEQDHLGIKELFI